MKITVLYRLTIRYEIMAMTCYQLQVIYTRVLFSSRSQVSKSWRTNVYLYVHVCIYVAIGEKNRETILLSLQACFVIAHSSRDYMRVCVCVCACACVNRGVVPCPDWYMYMRKKNYRLRKAQILYTLVVNVSPVRASSDKVMQTKAS